MTFVVLKIRVIVFDFAAEITVLSILCTLLGLCFLALIYQNFAWQLLVFFLLQRDVFPYFPKILYTVQGFFQDLQVKKLIWSSLIFC